MALKFAGSANQCAFTTLVSTACIYWFSSFCKNIFLKSLQKSFQAICRCN